MSNIIVNKSNCNLGFRFEIINSQRKTKQQISSWVFMIYQQIHHVGFIVPQCFDSMENVHGTLVLEHFTHNADGTKCPAAATSVPKDVP